MQQTFDQLQAIRDQLEAEFTGQAAPIGLVD